MSIKRLGPYLIQEVLGHGGMGTVFRAIDETNDNVEVAVKVLLAAYADDDHFRSRFQSEIQTLLQLDHPNIVRLLGHGEEDENLFFVMELVTGKSHHMLQKAGHHFSWQEVIGIAMDVCAGLQHAHYRGIIHRDIKPANLLKTNLGTTKITDFGIAKLFGAERLTAHGGAIGTADYMSPEQAQGKLVTERSDLFSLGCVMYSLLTGRPPFAEKNIQATIHNLTTKDPVSLRKLAPETPTEFEDLINRLLSKQPEDRFGTAQALNRRLVDMLQLIKSESEAQTSLLLEAESDEYVLASEDKTVDSLTATRKIHVGTVANVETPEKSDWGNQTLVENEKSGFYKTVNRKKRDSADEYQLRANGPLWPSITGMAVVLALMIGGILWTLVAQPDANQLFQQISESELPQTKTCEEFIKRFPNDERTVQVRLILAEIQSRKLEKKLAIKKKLHGVTFLYPIERLLLEALEKRKSNPVVAVQKLQTLIGIYRGDEELDNVELDALSAAIFQQERIQVQADDYIEKHTADIRRALQRAAKTTVRGSPSRSRLIYCSLIESFENQSWARDLVDTAKQELDQIKNLVDTATEKTQPVEHSATNRPE
ncbi:MAG: serine/threonine-protein kinase [Planctomycetota bacterium]|nr:serine/threonine-protein kinase [Planctomycetota bacterium]